MSIYLNRSWVIMLGAVVFGGIAVFASSRYISTTISREKAKLAPQVDTVDVVVAKTDLERGSLVGSETMAVRKMPREFVPGTAVMPEEFGNVEGAKLGFEMRAGEVLLTGTLEGADTATFATKISEGVRAMTLSVDEVNSISGLLQPGDRVDLFFTAKPPAANGVGRQARERTALLMQNVEVLATGRQVRPTITDGGTPGVGRTFSTITIQTNAPDAQRLILAQKAGSITAVLRGPTDQTPLTASAMDASMLFGAPATATGTRVARESGPRAEVIVGGMGRMTREFVSLAAAGSAPPAPAPTARTEPAASSTDQATAQLLRQIIDANRPPPSEPVTISSR
jgi:pilus assembly protein CpaB